MLNHYLKSAFRNLLRQKRFSFINILGLSIGLAVGLLVFVFVSHERSYEKSFADYEQIHRLTAMFTMEEEEEWLALTPYPLAPTLAAELPEVLAATRINDAWSETLFKSKNESFYIDDYAYVDTGFFKVFNYEFVSGDPQNALSQPNNVVLSEAMAARFFGKENPMGKFVNFNNGRDLQVAGVFKQADQPSHIDQDIFIPWRERKSGEDQWNNMLNYYSYVKLHAKTDIPDFEKKMNTLVQDRINQLLIADGVALDSEDAAASTAIKYKTQPVKDIHLHSHLDGEMGPNSHSFYLYIYMLVALAMLLIAIINFTNLSTARSANRAKEVGVRKVVGASRWESSVQFLIESILQTSIALILGFLLAEFMLPYFNQIMGLDLTLLQSTPVKLIGFGVVLAIGVGLIAGIYPAVFLSGFSPIKVLTGDFSKSKESAPMRKGLVIAQFSICATLILFLVIVSQQLNYMTGKSLGFNPDQIMVIATQDQRIPMDRMRSQLATIPGVQQISFANNLPGEDMGGNQYQIGEKSGIADFNRADENFLNTLDIKLTAGKFFTPADLTDSIEKIVVNQAFVDYYNIKENPIGQRESTNNRTIIGVVENFHWKGFNESIKPFVIQELNDPYLPKIALQIHSENMAQTVNAIQQKWSAIDPKFPIRYSFLDEDFGALFKSYQNFGKALSMITLLILFTAALGLFGLAAFMTEQRNKEIGIRKVLGATVAQMMILITKDFMKLVLIAAIVALPFGYFIAKKWLNGFAYQTDISPFPFVLTIAIILIISLLTVSWQAFRAANLNPVNAIKDE